MMETTMIANRCRELTTNVKINSKGTRPVLYWMSRDQRVNDNWALRHAYNLAAHHSVPLGVVFCLATKGFLGATKRHYGFMIKGLEEVDRKLQKLNIPFFLLHGEASKELPAFLSMVDASVLVTDFSPMKPKQSWNQAILASQYIKDKNCQFLEVDAHNIVPVWFASDKQEYMARTIRPKLMEKLYKYSHNPAGELPPVTADGKDSPALWSSVGSLPQVQVPTPSSVKMKARSPSPTRRRSKSPKKSVKSAAPVEPVDWKAVDSVLYGKGSLIDQSVPEITWCLPGEDAALARLAEFVVPRTLGKYATKRNDPAEDAQSGLSPYLHFGHIWPGRAILEVMKVKKDNPGIREAADGFIEEAFVRRELSDNFCYYNPEHTTLKGCANPWAYETLKTHEKDKREYVYTTKELNDAKTHDDLWNAAQRQLVHFGKIHGFMRMYWGKKILEWTPTPEKAFDTALMFNDRYSIDGRDPNGNVGVAWSIAGTHDMGWTERSVFGKIRFMNYNGCKRKFNIPTYIKKVNDDIAKEQKASAGGKPAEPAAAPAASKTTNPTRKRSRSPSPTKK